MLKQSGIKLAGGIMAIQQTVEIPVNHRITLEVPREIPAGKAILTFTPVSADIDEEALAFSHEFVEQHITAFRELAK
jgi:hypothetical protein